MTLGDNSVTYNYITMSLGSARSLAWSVGSINAKGLPYSTVKGASYTLVGGRLFVLGGLPNFVNSYRNSVLVLDIESKAWTEHMLPPYTARADHGAFLLDDYLYIYSGWNGRVLTDLFRLNLVTSEVEPLECRWEGMAEAVVDYFSGDLVESLRQYILFGGNWNSVVSGRLLALGVDTLTWFEPRSKGRAPSARRRHATACVGNSIYVYGGKAYASVYSDLYKLTLSGGQYVWSQLSGPVMHGLGCFGCTMVVAEGRLIVFGGRPGADDKAAVGIFSLAQNKWTTVVTCGTKSMPEERQIDESQVCIRVSPWPGAFIEHGAVYLSGKQQMLVLGGRGKPLRGYYTLECFDRTLAPV